MLSDKRCLEILNDGKAVFTEKEIKQIKELFYEFAEMEVDNYFRIQHEKVLKDEESNFNGKGKLR